MLPFARQLPARDVLDFLTENPLKGRLTFQSAEESFERRPDRSTPHGPAALSAALRCDIQTAPRPPQMPPFQAAGGRRSNRRFAAAPPAGLGKGSFGQRALRTPPSLRTEGVLIARGGVERWATGAGYLVERWATRRACPAVLAHHAAPGCGRWCRASSKTRLACPLLSCGEASKVRPWASLRKEVMPMVQLLRAVLANTVGRLLADLIRRLLD